MLAGEPENRTRVRGSQGLRGSRLRSGRGLRPALVAGLAAAGIAGVWVLAAAPRDPGSRPPTAPTPDLPAADLARFTQALPRLATAVAPEAAGPPPLARFVDAAARAESEPQLYALFSDTGIVPAEFRRVAETVARLAEERENARKMKDQLESLRAERGALREIMSDARHPAPLLERLREQEAYLSDLIEKVELSLAAHADQYGAALEALTPFLPDLERAASLAPPRHAPSSQTVGARFIAPTTTRRPT